MRQLLRLTLLAVSLTAPAVADCPDYPTAKPLGGPVAETMMGRPAPIPPPRRHLPLPAGAIASVRIRLTRTACYGTCPNYRVEIRGDGQALYHGEAYTMVTGNHRFTVPVETVRCLVRRFRAADFWSLAPVYQAAVSDNPTTRLTLEIGGRRKSVTDYLGRLVGMPASVEMLEQAIDRVAADRWVRGDGQTVAALQAEHFDFRSPAGAVILANAAKLDSPDVVLSLLAAGAPPNGRAFGHGDEDGPTAIAAAAANGRSQVVRALIAAGALASAAPETKAAALRAAVRAGDSASVTAVLGAAPPVDARDDDGATVLMQVADYPPDPAPDDLPVAGLPQRKAAIVRALLAAGADVRLRNADDTSALFGVDNADVVRLLLAAGADVEHRNGDGDTPLTAAGSDEAAMALIMAGADVTVVNDKGEGLFAHATEQKWPRTLAWLADHGQAVAAVTVAPPAWPPEVASLIARGFRFHTRAGAVMLIRAASEGRQQLALDLLAAGAPANQVDSDLSRLDTPSAIIAATTGKRPDLVRALIAAGAVVDAPYHAKEKALIAAAKLPDPEIVSLLLATRPDLNATDSDGLTPLAAAQANPPDSVAAEAKWTEAAQDTMRRLLAAGADPRQANERGDTALHHATSAKIVTLLLAAGADLEAQNRMGETPMLTIEDDGAAMAMIRAGANLRARNKFGETVLQHAKQTELERTLAYLRAHAR